MPWSSSLPGENALLGVDPESTGFVDGNAMAYSHEARTLLREPVNTDFRLLAGAVLRDVAAGCCLLSGGAEVSTSPTVASFCGAVERDSQPFWRRLRFAGLTGGDDLSVAGLEPEPVLAGQEEDDGSERRRTPRIVVGELFAERPGDLQLAAPQGGTEGAVGVCPSKRADAVDRSLLRVALSPSWVA